MRPEASRRRAAEDQRRGAARGQQGEVAGEGVGAAQHERRRDHQAEPGPAEQAEPADPLAESRWQQRDQAAEAKLPDPGRGHEVGARRVGVRVVDRVPERAGDDRARQEQRHVVPAGTPAPCPPRGERRERRDEEQQRPAQVELLLHGERPEVLYRARRAVRLEVVDRVPRELPVLEVERARPDLGGGVRQPRRRQQQPRGHPGHGQHEGRRGHEPLGAPSPEVKQGDLAGLVILAQQVPGDQEPGDHEEDVHAGEAAGEQRRVQVVDHHHADGQRPQALDVRAEAAFLRLLGLLLLLILRWDRLLHAHKLAGPPIGMATSMG